MTSQSTVRSEPYCPACGHYVPMRLDGEGLIEHNCNRTPPLDGLPVTIYVCRVCGGHGASRWGCWGRPDLPHDHVYMEPLHEIIAQINEGRRRR